MIKCAFFILSIFLIITNAFSLNQVPSNCYQANSFNNNNGTTTIKIIAKCDLDFSGGVTLFFKGDHGVRPWGKIPNGLDFYSIPNGYQYDAVENQEVKLVAGKSMLLNYKSNQVASSITLYTGNRSYEGNQSYNILPANSNSRLVVREPTYYGKFSLNNYTGKSLNISFKNEYKTFYFTLNSERSDYNLPAGHYKINAHIVNDNNTSLVIYPNDAYLNKDNTIHIQLDINSAYEPIEYRSIFSPYLETSALTDINQPTPQNWQYPFSKLSDLSYMGIRALILAFVLSDSRCGGDFYSVNYNVQLSKQIKDFVSNGGKIIASFGGANGPYVEDQFTYSSQCHVPGEATEVTLARVYKKFIDKYGVRELDFDIESSNVSNQNQVHLRNQALALLQSDPNYSDVKISYTLPVMPYGLLPNSLWLLRNAESNRVKVNRINIMTMNYGASFSPNQMGLHAINAAQSVFSQIKQIYQNTTDRDLWEKIGITPMIGFNDVKPEEFTLGDVGLLYDFALKHGIGMLSMWSVNRDRPGAYGNVSPSHNGETNVMAFDYSKKFMGY